MCFKRKYKIYHSKRRSLKILNSCTLPPHIVHLDDCGNPKPVLLTIRGIPPSVLYELAVVYDTRFELDTIEGYLSNISVVKVYSKDMAEDLIQNRKSRVIVQK